MSNTNQPPSRASVVSPIAEPSEPADPMALDPLSPINPPADPWFQQPLLRRGAPDRRGAVAATPIRRWSEQPSERKIMKIVVIGGTGLIGSKVVACLNEEDHEAVAASPDSGVNTLTGEGIAEALEGAEVVIDVSNSPSFEDEAVMEFFTTSTTNLLGAAAEAGVRHYVALSVVGAGRLPESGYLRAKVAQAALIDESSIPYTLVHATQFFEFTKRIADEATHGDVVRLPHVLFQPIAADDVAAAVCEISQRPPADGVIEIAGPDQFRFDEFIRDGLTAMGDPRTVVADPKARYFGTELQERSLVPDNAGHLGEIRFNQWLAQPAKA
jgi:uncharacterized protein YbjT (DUF2867 family)